MAARQPLAGDKRAVEREASSRDVVNWRHAAAVTDAIAFTPPAGAKIKLAALLAHRGPPATPMGGKE